VADKFEFLKGHHFIRQDSCETRTVSAAIARHEPLHCHIIAAIFVRILQADLSDQRQQRSSTQLNKGLVIGLFLLSQEFNDRFDAALTLA
jgi:hypothetical protein